MNLLLAMVLYPDVQHQAQGEIDALLGPPSSSADCRLPSMDDYEKLPYIRALVKELWRWNPAIPLGEVSPTYAEYVLTGTVHRSISSGYGGQRLPWNVHRERDDYLHQSMVTTCPHDSQS
jgi:cytochrome P450